MIPRTVRMAAEVASLFTDAELDAYGNIILNGIATTGPNTINKKAWQYAETTTAPVNLPSITRVRPAFKGWTTNYMQYFTRNGGADYNVLPGYPTNFDYTVHSFTEATGVITGTGNLFGGSGYDDGVYTLPAIGGSGSGATLNITVVGGTVTVATVSFGGDDYKQGDLLFANIPDTGGVGQGFHVNVATINPTSVASQPKWAQVPRRFNNFEVSDVAPPQYENNPNVIQYSFLYPVSDSLSQPPIDYVAP